MFIAYEDRKQIACFIVKLTINFHQHSPWMTTQQQQKNVGENYNIYDWLSQ